MKKKIIKKIFFCYLIAFFAYGLYESQSQINASVPISANSSAETNVTIQDENDLPEDQALKRQAEAQEAAAMRQAQILAEQNK